MVEKFQNYFGEDKLASTGEKGAITKGDQLPRR
jgi:hypothetical protein